MYGPDVAMETAGGAEGRLGDHVIGRAWTPFRLIIAISLVVFPPTLCFWTLIGLF